MIHVWLIISRSAMFLGNIAFEMTFVSFQKFLKGSQFFGQCILNIVHMNSVLKYVCVRHILCEIKSKVTQ